MAENRAIPLSIIPNWELLEEQMKAAFGEKYRGYSSGGKVNVVWMYPEVTNDEILRVHQVELAHDSSQRTAAQIAEESRKAQLAAYRARNLPSVDPEAFKADPNLYSLATQLAWLQAELFEMLRPKVGG